MLPFEIVLLLLAFCVGLGMLARYCHMPYPIFWVIFATLVGQGLTLPVLIRWLGVDRQPGAEETVKPEENGSC